MPMPDLIPVNTSESALAEAAGPVELTAADPAIRAEFLRAQVLIGAGGECGLTLRGARIAGALDLEGCRAPRWVDLTRCRFDKPLHLRGAALDGLTLDEAEAPGLRLSRVELRGDLRLRGAKIVGETTLRGARIGGDLIALNARLDRAGSVAIEADGLRVGGSVFLSGAEIRGAARFLDARIARHLACIGCRISRPGSKALRLDGARIGGVFFLRRGARIEGALDLTAARIGALSDDPDCWPAPGDLLLNRCDYGGLTGGPVDAASRLDWLARMDPAARGRGFQPQPYCHLARTLRRMGHECDARTVLIEKERRARAHARARLSGALREAIARRRAAPNAERRLAAGAPIPRLRLTLALARLRDAALDLVVGHGHAPARALIWALPFWLIGAGVFHYAWTQDAMKPRDPRLLGAPAWVLCQDAPSRLSCYLSSPEGASYPRFQPLLYALDALAPVVDLRQEEFWLPADERPVGRAARAWGWAHTLAGWALTLLAAAGISGVVKKD